MKSYCTPVLLALVASGLALAGKSNAVARKADLSIEVMTTVLVMLLHGGRGPQLYITMFVARLVHNK